MKTTITTKEAWRLIRTKQKDLTEREQIDLILWFDHWFGPIFRILVFPIAFVIKGIKTAYEWTWDN